MSLNSWFKNEKRGRKRVRALVVMILAVAWVVIMDLFGPTGFGADNVVEPLVEGYRLIPKSVRPHSCPSRPNCSQYLIIATQKHGLALGAVLTADRLMHEHGRLAEGPWVEVKGRRKVLDPVPDKTSFSLMFTTRTRPPAQLAVPQLSRVKDPDEQRYKMAWRFAALGHWAGAATMFRSVSPDSKYGAKAAWLAARLAKQPLPRPHWAAPGGWLSLIPGLGQLWLNRPKDAAWAAALTYGLGGAAVACLAVGSAVGTVVFGLPALACYLGNIHNALSSAARTNQLERQAFLNKLINGAAAVP